MNAQTRTTMMGVALMTALLMNASIMALAADRLSAGWRHSVAIDDAGAAWAWGENRLGQLGDGGFARSARPVSVVGPGGERALTDVVAVAAGSFHTLAIRGDGTLWAWGNNAFGQLGNGAFGLDGHSPVPVQVRGPGGEGFPGGVVAAAGGWDHSVAVLDDGSVWAWGSACQGQLGDGERDANRREVYPVQVHTDLGPLTGVTAVACGAYHTLALREDGTVWAWGANFEAQLGTGIAEGDRYRHQFRLNLSWAPPSPGRWSIKLGYVYTDPTHRHAADRLALTDEYEGAVIVVTEDEPAEVAERSATTRRWGDQVESFVQMASTLAHPSAAEVGRRVALRLEDVRVGLGAHDDDYAEDIHLVLTNEATGETARVRPAPAGAVATQVLGPEGQERLEEVAQVAAGMFHSVAALQDGTVVAWGYNGTGQAGRRDLPTQVRRPVPIPGLDGPAALDDVVSVAAGYENTYALLADGSVWAWGWNVYGELGSGWRPPRQRSPRTSMALVSLGEASDAPTVGDAVRLAAGMRHALVVSADGTVRGWGHNAFGQLGNGGVADSPVATPVGAFEPRARQERAEAPAPTAERADEPPADAPVFNVREHGAAGDGIHLDMAALQAAIDAAHEAGGGVALVPPGVYRTGMLELKSGVTLHVQRGAVILGSTNRAHFPSAALIIAREARDIGITGGGVIDGQGQAWPSRGARVQIIQMWDCEGIEVSDVATNNSGSWTQHYIKCRDLTIRNVTVNSARPARNNDGIDLSGCEDVLIEGCTVIADDDPIVIKSQSADRVNRNIRVINNTVYTYRGGFKIGTETRGEFRDIVVRDLRVYGAKVLEVSSVDGSDVNGVDIENVWAEDAWAPIAIRLGSRLRESYFGPGEERVPGRVRNVRMANVRIHVSDLPYPPYREVLLKHGIAGAEVARESICCPVSESFIAGIPEHFVEDVLLENIFISAPGGGSEADALIEPAERADVFPRAGMFGRLPAWGFFIRHARGVTLRDVRLELRAPDGRPPLIHKNVQDLTVEGLSVHEAWR